MKKYTETELKQNYDKFIAVIGMNHYVSKLTDLKDILSVLEIDLKLSRKNKNLVHVKKILDAKYKVGLANYKPTASNNLLADLNRQKDNVLYQSLMENAITLVQNKNNLLPLKNLDLCKIAYVNMGTADASPFVKTLKKYTQVDMVSANDLDTLVFKLNQYNTVIILIT